MSTLEQQSRASSGSGSAAATGASNNSSDLCRVHIVGPTGSMDLAIPAHAPIIELLPTIVAQLDPGLATRGLAHDGWVLQPLGEIPLDEATGTAAAGILDGDVLYLRPRRDVLAPIQHDDLVDGVQRGLNARHDTWTARSTRRAALAGSIIACALAVAVASMTGDLRSLTFAALAAVLVAGGGVVARRLDGDVGMLLLFVGVICAGAGAASAPAALGIEARPSGVVEAGMAAIAVALTAVIASYVAGAISPVMISTTAAAFAAALALVPAVIFHLSAPAAAAILLAVMFTTIRFIPMMSAWLGGIVVEPVPVTEEAFQEGLDPVPADVVAAKALASNRVVSALLVGWSTAVGAALVVVATDLTPASIALVVAVCAALLLQARELPGVWHRGPSLIATAVGLTALVWVWVIALPLIGRLALLVALLAVIANGIALVFVLPHRRLNPLWGRAGDVAHWLCSAAIPALMLTLCGFFVWLADLI